MRLGAILGIRSELVSRGKAIRLARKAPLFRSMSSTALSELIDESSQTIYDVNATIVQQGEQDDSVYMVLTGRVRVVYADASAAVPVAELGAGDVFGELAVLEKKPRNANVVTLERTNCLRVPGFAFINALKQSQA